MAEERVTAVGASVVVRDVPTPTPNVRVTATGVSVVVMDVATAPGPGAGGWVRAYLID